MEPLRPMQVVESIGILKAIRHCLPNLAAPSPSTVLVEVYFKF
jgi:hypothetical protein